MMSSTMTIAPVITPQSHSSHPSKARANSDDYYVDNVSGSVSINFVGGNSSSSSSNNGSKCASQSRSSVHYDAYSLQRAVSSDARLPSRQHDGPQQNQVNDVNEDDELHLQHCPSDGLTLSSSNETDEEVFGGSSAIHHTHMNAISSTSHRISPSPSKSMPPSQQQQQVTKRSVTSSSGLLITRCLSDTTHNSGTGSAARRILQTIESGIPLGGDNPTTTTTAITTTPKPPRRWSAHRGEYCSSNSNPSPPSHLHLSPHHHSQHSNVSFTSHYSVDAGKHGFLSHSPPPSPPPIRHSFSGNGDEDSTAGDGGHGGGGGGGGDANSIVSNSGSIVFKYLPGQETPPAEYALPVSILKVYGDALVDEIDDMLPHHVGVESGGGVVDARDILPVRRKVLVDSFENENDRQTEVANNKILVSSSQSALPPPPPVRLDTSSAGPVSEQPPQRILPYHERKRLSELVEKEKRRKNKNSTTNTKFGASDRSPLIGIRSVGYGGTTPLLANGNNYADDNVANSRAKPSKDTRKWFGQLVAIITGKTTFHEKECDDEEKGTTEQSNGLHPDPKQTYRDQAEAFLKKTEVERMKIKELCLTTRQQSFDRRAKSSSLSGALDSIPSYSGEEEEVETEDDSNTNQSSYNSSEEEEDEEYGSFYFGNRTGNGGGVTPSSTIGSRLSMNTTPKVWRYGEPMEHSSLLAKKHTPTTIQKQRISEHDLIMRRDRLLQEEYEYRLRALQRENENLSKKFRIFVLVTVAIIFTGALTFAFVVCIRMLMSI